jgi:hypothetical protein
MGYSTKIDNQTMTALLIVLRQSPDWSRITRQEYREQSREFCRSIGRPLDQMNDIVDLWDSTFRISYFEIRQQMKDIAKRNLAAVRNAETVDHAAFRAGEVRPICFVDDDDWFAPDLGEYLDCTLGYDGFVWTHVALGSPSYPLHRWPAGESELLCLTNNYAVTAEYATRNGIAHITEHWQADPVFRSLRIGTIPEPLSVANKHPACIVFLERNLEGQLTRNRLKHVIKTFVRGTRSVDEPSLTGIEWARTLIRDVNERFERVLASER